MICSKTVKILTFLVFINIVKKVNWYVCKIVMQASKSVYDIYAKGSNKRSFNLVKVSESGCESIKRIKWFNTPEKSN